MRRIFFVILAFIIVSSVFFFPIFQGKIPFPGDLLIGEYAPYSSYSFLGYAPGGYPNKGQDFDVLRLLYPDKEFSVKMFKDFEFPLWNPYNFSGTPHIASLQSGSFYPLNIIFFLLPYLNAWTIYILLQPILTGIFTYLFARELKLGVRSSIFSALVFSFSSYCIVWMEYGTISHTIVWMPFALWVTLKNLKKPTVLKSVTISLALTLAILAGHIQTAFYVFVFLLGFIIYYIFFVDRQDKSKKLLMFGLIFILPVLLSAVQLFPMVELFFRSARAPYPHLAFLKLLIPPFHAVSMFVPDFFGNPATRNYWVQGTYIERVTYIGVIPLIFIFYSFFKKQSVIFWFFVISAVAILLLTFDTLIAQAVYFFQIPFVSTAVPTRIMFLFCFPASLLAGYGLEAFIKNPDRKIFLKVGFILGGIYLALWLFVFIAPAFLNFSWVENLRISKRNLILPTGIFSISMIALFLSFYLLKYKKTIIVFLIILSMADLFYFFHKITPFAPKETIYPSTEVSIKLREIQGIDRSWGYGSGYIDTNLQMHEKMFSVDGYNALHSKRYGELISSSKNGKIASFVPGTDAVIAPGYGENDLRENKYRQRLLNLLGVKYVLNKSEFLGKNYSPDYNTFPEETYKLVWQGAPWQIYENKEVLPRVFLASSYVVEKDKDKIVQMIFDDKFDLKDKIILEEEISPKISLAEDKNAKVKMETYAPNKIVLQTSAVSNMLLFISDNYYQGWKVSVDGKSDKIYRADYSFRAVSIPKGIHEVKFWYSPNSFVLGLWISGLSFFGILLSVLIVKGKNNVK
jgi:hypothetical protein